MAKKTKAAADSKGFDTFDLVSGETFNPVAQEAEREAFWEEETKKMRENVREPVWHDILKLMCGQKIKNKESLTYDKITNFTKSNAFFMILQGYAHTNPVLANVLNMKDISPAHATDIIFKHMRKTYPRGGWEIMNKFYPLNRKEKKGVEIVTKEGKKVNIEISENDVKEYCKEHAISLKDFDYETDVARDMGIDVEKYLAEWVYYKKERDSGGKFVKVSNKKNTDDIPEQTSHPTVLIPEYLAALWDAKTGRQRTEKVTVQIQTPVPTHTPIQQQPVIQTQQLALTQQLSDSVVVQNTTPATKLAVSGKRISKKWTPPEPPTNLVKFATYDEKDSQKETLIPTFKDGVLLMFTPTDLHITDKLS